MKNSLNSISIENLRGCVKQFDLQFEKDKNLTIIYGENASGKTTICDAFEFIGKGSISSLAKKGLNKTNKYWASIGKDNTDIEVTLNIDQTPVTAKILKNKVVVDPNENLPKIEVLRKNQILDLIAAEEAKRYDEIKRFIDVSEIEYAEDTLKKSIDNLKKGRETAATRVIENKEAINKFWEESGKKSNNPLTWAKAEIGRETKKYDDEIKAIKNLNVAYDYLKDYPNRLERLENTIKVKKKDTQTLKKQIEEKKPTKKEKDKDIISLLKESKSYIEEHPDLRECPLCGSSEKIENLLKRINKRLESFTTEIDYNSKLKQAEQNYSDEKKKLTTLEENAIEHINKFKETLKGHEWPKDIKLPSVTSLKDIHDIEKWIEETATIEESWEKSKNLRSDKKQFRNTLKNIYDMYRENYDAQKEIDKIFPKLSKIHEIIIDERKKFTDEVLKKIATEVGRLYEIVHPGEGLHKISMMLDPDKRASLGISAEFYGISGNPPQAYFSESHLDTLGLCIFLAICSMEQPESTILVLDDVIASVDEPHVERLIEMLYSETQKFKHCIITTHYKPWKHKYRWGWLNNGQCNFIELGKWDKKEGIKTFNSVPDIQKLKELLEEIPPDPQIICAKASFILEAVLDFITSLYECSVPKRASGKYTLGELLPAISKKLRETLTVHVHTGENENGEKQYDTISLTPVIKEITRVAQIRNVFGCHFNEISFELLDSDAIDFSKQVYTLANTIADTENGWPKNDKSGMYWSNKKETRKLFPLKRPS